MWIVILTCSWASKCMKTYLKKKGSVTLEERQTKPKSVAQFLMEAYEGSGGAVSGQPGEQVPRENQDHLPLTSPRMP